jgi:hypothetical protein
MGGKQIEGSLTLSGGLEGPGGGMPVAVVVTVVVMTDGTVTMLVNVMGGFPSPGEPGTLLSLCWEPMNKPMKIEQSRRKRRRRTSNNLLRGVSGS